MAKEFARTLSGLQTPRRLWKSLVGLAKTRWRSPAVPKRTHYREEADDYGPGGFCQINLGDQFKHSRYTVIRKLGYGEYSTVWLAHDSELCQHVALKVLRSDCYGGRHDIFEANMLETISKISKHSTHPGQNHVLQLLDHFGHVGPHGDHTCLITSVLGPHLGFHITSSRLRMLPIRVVKTVVRQLLLGLDFLHRECGIIHTDLKPTNILLELEEPEDAVAQHLSETSPLTTADMDSHFNQGHNTVKLVVTGSSLNTPATEIIATPVITRMKNVNVRIIDLGVSSWIDKHLSDRIQSPFLRAPEVTIGAPWSTGVDIWSLGCLTFEFVRGYPLFAGTAAKSGVWSADDHRLALMIEWVGPFTTEFLARGKKTKDFFDTKGTLLRCHGDIKQTSLEKILDGDHPAFQRPVDLPKCEVTLLIDFLRGMLVLDPEQRKSAAQMLEHDWLKEEICGPE